MSRALAILDRILSRLSHGFLVALAVAGVAIVGVLDYLTSYEVSVALFYLGPVAIAAWYVGRRAGVAIAVISALSWCIADLAAGAAYSHPAILVWNALIRVGGFVVTSVLLTALHDSYQNQRHMARTDALTGLYSRRAFMARLEHDLALAQRRSRPVTLAYVDLDDFKSVNDNHGHVTGDRVLQTTGRVLGSTLRQADTAARLGGDEFALVLPDTDASGAQQVIGNVARDLRAAFDAENLAVTCSIGVVTFARPGLTVEKALAAADTVMYDVKRRGKGSVAFSAS